MHLYLFVLWSIITLNINFRSFPFLMLLYSRRKSDSEDEDSVYKQSNAKLTADYVGESLSHIAEGGITYASDQPRLI